MENIVLNEAELAAVAGGNGEVDADPRTPLIPGTPLLPRIPEVPAQPSIPQTPAN